MGRHIVFFVHGVGLHGTAWAEDALGPVATLAEVSQRYAYFAARPLGALIEPVTIRYDHVFSAAVNRWRTDAAEAAAADPGGVIGSVIGTLSSATEEAFWWSHVADVVMYRYLRAYRQRVRTEVIRQMAERIERAWDEDGSASCSVVAHSLGTAVAHDALHLLGTQQWGGAGSPFNPRHWRFQHVAMLANTSRLLQSPDDEVPAAYDSIVRPGPVEDAESYCATYLNIRHELDPIAFPRRFDPVGWRQQFSTVTVNHYWNPDIHGFSHHLQHPRVHIPLLRRLTKRSAISGEEEIREVAGFPRFRLPATDDAGVPGGGTAQTPLERAKEHLVALQALMLQTGEDLTAPRLARIFLTVIELVRRYSA